MLSFPGATNSDVLTKIDDVLNEKPASLISSKTSPNTVLTFSSIIFRKDKKNLEKTRADTNSRLKNFCRQKKINLISNDNIKEEHLGIKKLHLNRKGNSIFAKNLLNFIEGNWDISPLGDSYYESENASNTIITNAKRILRDIRTSNINRLVFGHLNINSLRTKFDFLCEQIEGSIDVFMIPESKLDDSFPHGQFLIDGFHTPFRFDRNKNGGGILLYVREDIPAKILSHDFPSAESFFVEIILHKKKWLINCSYSPNKNNIKNDLEIISKALDAFSTKYENNTSWWF